MQEISCHPSQLSLFHYHFEPWLPLHHRKFCVFSSRSQEFSKIKAPCITFYNYIFIIHSVSNSKIKYFRIRYSLHNLYIQFQSVHSVLIQFSSNWYIIHLLYIQFQFHLDTQIHIQTNLTFDVYSLYIQLHILRHDISQFNIR